MAFQCSELVFGYEIRVVGGIEFIEEDSKEDLAECESD